MTGELIVAIVGVGIGLLSLLAAGISILYARKAAIHSSDSLALQKAQAEIGPKVEVEIYVNEIHPQTSNASFIIEITSVGERPVENMLAWFHLAASGFDKYRRPPAQPARPLSPDERRLRELTDSFRNIPPTDQQIADRRNEPKIYLSKSEPPLRLTVTVPTQINIGTFRRWQHPINIRRDGKAKVRAIVTCDNGGTLLDEIIEVSLEDAEIEFNEDDQLISPSL